MNKNQKPDTRIRLTFFLFTFMVSSTALFAIDAPQFSLAPFTEIAYGQSFEHVYYSDKILSELIWDMKPLYLVGLEALLEWKKGFFLDTEASFGIPTFTGLMEDSDWYNLSLNLDTGKTHFSRHNAKLTYATILSINTGWSFFPRINNFPDFSITPSLGFKYFSWKWNAQDGYVQHNSEIINGTYPEWQESQSKNSIAGVGISYEQIFYIPTLGISGSYSPIPTIETNLGITFSPLVYSHNTDCHFIPSSNFDFRNAKIWDEYHDILSGGLFFEPEISVIWSFSHNIRVLFIARKTIISRLRGSTSSLKAGESTTTWFYEEDGNGGGAALDTVSLRLGCIFNLNTL